MPGLSIIIKDNIIDKKSRIIPLVESLNYSDRFSEKIILFEQNAFIAWNKYSTYPINDFKCDDWLVIIEGMIYDKSLDTIRSEIHQILNHFSENAVKNWIMNIDGDFIVYCYNRNENNLIVFNDILGHIPLYYKKISDGFIISRYIKFISANDNNQEFDITGFGEFLLFGFLLGTRTLFKNIEQLRPSSIVNYKSRFATIRCLKDFNFDFKQHSTKNFEEVVSDVSLLLSKACINRFCNNQKNIIALSGGMDSRTVAACLRKNNIDFVPVTINYLNGVGIQEIEISTKLAQVFGRNLSEIKIHPPNGADIKMLISLKEGMNYLATVSLLPFYHEIIKEFGDKINFITGDKGDKITLSYDNPINKCKSIEDLLRFILDEHSIFSLDEIAFILNVKKDDILHDLYLLLEEYPEQDFSNKYIHFRAVEKTQKSAFQGIDRHNQFIWNYSPLTSTPFVQYLFNCSNEHKKMHRLFISLLKNYSDEAAQIKYINFKSPIISLNAKLFMFAVYHIYPKISSRFRKKVKDVFFGGNPVVNKDSIYFNCINEQLKNSESIINYFRIKNSDALKNYSMLKLQSIFTLTTLVDNYNFQGQIIDKYLEDEFDPMK